jgi:hypothetical protein
MPTDTRLPSRVAVVVIVVVAAEAMAILLRHVLAAIAVSAR